MASSSSKNNLVSAVSSLAGDRAYLAAVGGGDRRTVAPPAARRPRGRPTRPARNNSRRPPSSIQYLGRLDLNLPAPNPEEAVEGLRLIIQKELTSTDVGPLKRIVLPKNYAEYNLPILKNREGRNLRMHDIETFQLWEFKFKYWPNNKGRMYVLENTGEYIETHSLHAGDFVMIYRDDDKGDLIIRSKKARRDDATNSPQFDGIFDSIVPDFKVARPRYSDLFSSWTQFGSNGCDLSLAFQPLPFPDDTVTTTTSSDQGSASSAPLTNFDNWSPSNSSGNNF